MCWYPSEWDGGCEWTGWQGLSLVPTWMVVWPRLPSASALVEDTARDEEKISFPRVVHTSSLSLVDPIPPVSLSVSLGVERSMGWEKIFDRTHPGGMDPLLQDIDRTSVSFDSFEEDRDGKGHAWEISVGSKGPSDTRATSFGLTSHDARAWTHTPTTTSQDDDKPRRRHEIVRDQRRPSLRKEDSEARET